MMSRLVSQTIGNQNFISFLKIFIAKAVGSNLTAFVIFTAEFFSKLKFYTNLDPLQIKPTSTNATRTCLQPTRSPLRASLAAYGGGYHFVFLDRFPFILYCRIWNVVFCGDAECGISQN